jgi:hypothetical protein
MLATIQTSGRILNLLRATERYITAKAASNTPPNTKIKVVTMPTSISRNRLVGMAPADAVTIKNKLKCEDWQHENTG